MGSLVKICGALNDSKRRKFTACGERAQLRLPVPSCVRECARDENRPTFSLPRCPEWESVFCNDEEENLFGKYTRYIIKRSGIPTTVPFFHFEQRRARAKLVTRRGGGLFLWTSCSFRRLTVERLLHWREINHLLKTLMTAYDKKLFQLLRS